jgi:cellulose biosynthesis protein BcsQ
LANQVLDISEYTDCGKDYFYLLSKEKLFSEVILEARPPNTGFRGLYLLGTYNTHKKIKNYFEYQFYDEHLRVKFIVKEASRNGFDYIVFDSSAAYDFYTKHVLSLAHQIIPILQGEEFGVEKFALLIQDLKALKDDFMVEFQTDCAIANMVDKNRALHREFLSVFNDTPFKKIVFPVSNEIPNAAANHKVIQEYQPKKICVLVFNEMAALIHEGECFLAG